MTKGLVIYSQKELTRIGLDSLPLAIQSTGDSGIRRFLEFFAVTIRNKNTRLAYAQAIKQFFDWCEVRGVTKLDQVLPVVIAAYIEQHGVSLLTC